MKAAIREQLRYRMNRKIRALATWITGVATVRSNEERLDFHREQIKRILLVRATFRLGDSVLATPAIFLFRKRFPDAQIDFVGPVISKTLFENLPIDNHYQIFQRPPKAAWAYLPLLKRIRSMKYDLAVDVSCSKSALGGFIVGLSGARFRVGLKGRHDTWLNVRLDRPEDYNKYRNFPAFMRSMGLEAQDLYPSIILSADEREEGRRQLGTLLGERDRARPVIGIFVGGRKTWGKRWPKENFRAIINDLHGQGIKVIVFIGPEEKDVIPYFRETLPIGVPVVSELSVRMFAAMVSNCDLFLCCDSGPMHLACALGVRTIAVFLLRYNSNRWAPPSNLARMVYQEGEASVSEVIDACCLELNLISRQRKIAKTVNA